MIQKDCDDIFCTRDVRLLRILIVATLQGCRRVWDQLQFLHRKTRAITSGTSIKAASRYPVRHLRMLRPVRLRAFGLLTYSNC